MRGPDRHDARILQAAVGRQQVAEGGIGESDVIDAHTAPGIGTQPRYADYGDAVVFLIVGQEGSVLIAERFLCLEQRLVEIDQAALVGRTQHYMGELGRSDLASLAGGYGNSANCIRRVHWIRREETAAETSRDGVGLPMRVALRRGPPAPCPEGDSSGYKSLRFGNGRGDDVGNKYSAGHGDDDGIERPVVKQAGKDAERAAEQEGRGGDQ